MYEEPGLSVVREEAPGAARIVELEPGWVEPFVLILMLKSIPVLEPAWYAAPDKSVEAVGMDDVRPALAPG